VIDRVTWLWGACSAPELFLDEDAPLNTKADVYSFGIILWELLTCEVPYPDINDLKEVYEEIVVNGASSFPSPLSSGVDVLF
jgi:serine/threonine protein kinase